MTTPLPANVGYGTVIGKLITASADTLADPDSDPDAAAVSGTVTFTPSVDRLVDASAATVILPRPISVALDETGAFTVRLVATDDPDLNPINWTYMVTFDLVGTVLAFFHIAVPQGQTVDLSSVIPVPPSAGEGTPPASGADIAAHVGAADPHPVYLTAAEGNAAYDATGAASAATTAHAAAADPHPVYLTAAEGTAAFHHQIRYTAGAWPARPTGLVAGSWVVYNSMTDVGAPAPTGAAAGDQWFAHSDSSAWGP